MKKILFLLLIVSLTSCDEGSVWTANQKLDQYEVKQDITKMYPVYLKVDSDYWRIYKPDGNISAKFIPVAPEAPIATWGKIWFTVIISFLAGWFFTVCTTIGFKNLY